PSWPWITSCTWTVSAPPSIPWRSCSVPCPSFVRPARPPDPRAVLRDLHPVLASSLRREGEAPCCPAGLPEGRAAPRVGPARAHRALPCRCAAPTARSDPMEPPVPNRPAEENRPPPHLEEEALVHDARAGLRPAQIIERKLAILLQTGVLPMS